MASNSITPSGKGPLLKIRTKSTSVDDFVQRHARDFSTQGVFVMTRRPLEVGAPLGVEFQLVDEQPVFSCRGVVAWRREPTDDPNRTAGMGVAFAQLHADATDLLARMVRQRGAATSRFDEEPGSAPAPVAPRTTTAPGAAAPRTTTRPARGLWSAAGNSPRPAAADAPEPPSAATGELRASQLFSSPDLAPVPRAESVHVEPSAQAMPRASVATPRLSQLEPEPETPASSDTPSEPDALQLPDLPSSGGVVVKDEPRSSDPARAERFSKLIRALRAVSTPPDEPSVSGGPLLVALVLAGGLIAFTVYLSGSGLFGPLIDTLVRGLKSLAARAGI